MRTGPNERRYINYINLDTLALTKAREGLGMARFELTAEQRAGRVEAYRLQVALAGQIVQWLPPPAEGRPRRRQASSLRTGRQWRWFQTGRLEGSAYSPAFVRGG